jgi:hypothetical protein
VVGVRRVRRRRTRWRRDIVGRDILLLDSIGV